MSAFGTLARSWARSVDYNNVSHAQLDTGGARPETHTVEKRLTLLQNVLSKPVITFEDLRAFNDFVKHGDAIDDRKLLLEVILTKMARYKDFSLSLKLQQAVISLLFKDLPHPPIGFLSPLDITRTIYDASQSGSLSPSQTLSTPQILSPPQMPRHVSYAYRAPDGSNYNPLIPGLGKVGSPYARSVPSTSLTPKTALPDPNLIFDTLLKRDKFEPHPDGISSLFFAFADLVIHSIFKTDPTDWRINQTSSYLDLSILYGNSDKELDGVRAKDGTGKLKPDCFADARLLMMPPASCALLILLNRNHNFIAQKLFDINECGRFKDPSLLSLKDQDMQDDEIFHRTRLINCGYFMHIILGDYVGAILGLVRDGYDWRLDPLMEMRGLDHSVSPRGAGNVVSIEFNLLYRWHATLSKGNVEWLERELAEVFPKDAGIATVQGFKEAASNLRSKWEGVPPTEWVFGGKTRVDGQFRDADLAEILQSATKEVAGAFKARGIPECMRVVEVLGIMQSRRWGTCSLNEFRKFMGLKPYASFSEWNKNSDISEAAERLYRDIDRLELHVGLQAEQVKEPGPGAGLCPGYTISRAILADAVCLTRGDRFLTTDFTPFNLTAWGWQDCQYDKEDGSYGGLLTKLFFRTLPDHYPTGSVLAHFPFHIPKNMIEALKKNGGSVDKYVWPAEFEKLLPDDVGLLPITITNHAWKHISNYESVKKVLTTEASNFTSNVTQRQESTVEPVLRQRKRGKNDTYKKIRERQAAVTKAITDGDKWTKYFREETETLMQRGFEPVGSHNPKWVDIVTDVINLLPIHWICDEITGIPLKSECNRRGVLYEPETREKFADIAHYIYIDSTPVNDFKFRERSQKYAQELIEFIEENLEGADNHFASIGSDVLGWFKRKSGASKYLKELRSSVGNVSNANLAVNIFNATIPTAAPFSKAVAQVVDYFLDDANEQARSEIVMIYQANEKDAAKKIMGYIREVLRLRPIFPGIYRTPVVPVPAYNLNIHDWVFVDIAKANESLGQTPDYNRPAGKQGILTPYEDGLLTPSFFEAVVPVIVGTILSHKNLRRAGGESGKLTKFVEPWHGTKRQQYVDISGMVTPWPDAMIVEFESET